jgi:hypothetical protein
LFNCDELSGAFSTGNFQLAYNFLGLPTLARLSPSETASLSNGTRRSSARLLRIKSEFTVRRTSP